MKQKQAVQTDRIVFLDKLRYWIVLAVVVFHVAAAYAPITGWWAVNDRNAMLFNEFIMGLSLFLMPTLFFIAGYFTLPSHKGRSTWQFIRKKLKRLGIPCLIFIPLYNPFQMFIWEYSRHYSPVSFREASLMAFQSAAKFRTGIVTSSLEFHHHYFWFISLLLLFFIVFALGHRTVSSFTSENSASGTQKKPSYRSILLVFFLAGVIIVLENLFTHEYLIQGRDKEPWIIIANLIEFQASKLFLYIVFFGLGIYAFHNNWFSEGKLPSRAYIWIILIIVLSYLLRDAAITYFAQPSTEKAIIFVILRNFLRIVILIALLSGRVASGKSVSRIHNLLARNSYSIYLVHMVFVLISQLTLFKLWDGSSYLKFVLGSVASVGLSIVFAEFAVRKYPVRTVLGMISLFCIFLMMPAIR